MYLTKNTAYRLGVHIAKKDIYRFKKYRAKPLNLFLDLIYILDMKKYFTMMKEQMIIIIIIIINKFSGNPTELDSHIYSTYKQIKYKSMKMRRKVIRHADTLGS